VKILPGIARGEITFAMGLTEPDVGSDLTHLATRARKDGDSYVVNGQKVFTTGADTADYIFLFVRTDATESASRGLSVLLVPRTTPGVTVRPLRKLSGQGTHTCEVFLEDVRVPLTALVGEENHGAKVIFSLLDVERIYVGAQACGIAQGAFDVAVRYANERKQFGKPIIEHQAVGHMIADMAYEIEMIRLLTWRAAWKIQSGIPCSVDASMVKIAGSEACTRVVSMAMQVLGGYSYTTDFPLERYWRETKLNEIAGGTNQIQRNIIAKSFSRDRSSTDTSAR
jgi:alkylation response protein AidB-like acyl-CoA dehydrogenase